MAVYLKYCVNEKQYSVAFMDDAELDKAIEAGKIHKIPEGMPIEYRAEDLPEEYKTKVMKPVAKTVAKGKKTED